MIITLLDQNTVNTILFSSVTSFSENYNASVTSHPVESGKSISDNITNDNAKFQLSGVISDFDYFNPVKELAYGTEAGYDDTILNKFNLSSFKDGKFVSPSLEIPSEFTAAYAKQSLKEARDRGTLFSIFVYDDSNKLEKHYPNCALTSLSFKQETDTEFCIYPEMSFEQLNIVDVLIEQIDKNKVPLLSDKNLAAGQVSKGKSDECLDTLKVDDDGNSTPDKTKPKVAKGQRPPPKCEPGKNKVGSETLEQFNQRQADQLSEARQAAINALNSYRESKGKVSDEGFIQRREISKVLWKYATRTLPEMQSKERAEFIAAHPEAQ